MKKIILIFLILFSISCKDEKKIVEKTKFYYLSCFQNHMTEDTIKYEEVNYIDSIDELIATEHFKYKEQYHIIKMYSSDNHAPVDGGGLKYSLDSIGVIYSRAIWWPNFGRLASNNDSINDLISTALGYIISRSSLRCFYCNEKYTHIPNQVELK